MKREKSAEEEIADIIEEVAASKNPPKRKRREKLPEGPGEKCLYSWTCGPRNDGRCPYSACCADWKRALVLCAHCIYRHPSIDENGHACVLCMRSESEGSRIPLNGYCSEGVLDRFQDAARYL